MRRVSTSSHIVNKNDRIEERVTNFLTFLAFSPLRDKSRNIRDYASGEFSR